VRSGIGRLLASLADWASTGVRNVTVSGRRASKGMMDLSDKTWEEVLESRRCGVHRRGQKSGSTPIVFRLSPHLLHELWFCRRVCFRPGAGENISGNGRAGILRRAGCDGGIFDDRSEVARSCERTRRHF